MSSTSNASLNCWVPVPRVMERSTYQHRNVFRDRSVGVFTVFLFGLAKVLLSRAVTPGLHGGPYGDD